MQSFISYFQFHDASDHCLALGQVLVSKDTSISWSTLAPALTLDSSKKYWLKEYWNGNSSYAYQIRYRSGSWGIDNGDGRTASSYPFICLNRP